MQLPSATEYGTAFACTLFGSRFRLTPAPKVLMPRPALRSLLACGCAVMLSACGRDDGGGRGGQAKGADVPDSLKYGGTVTVGSFGDLQSMNALVSSDNNSSQVQQYLLFMPLVKYDAELNPVPWLAER